MFDVALLAFLFLVPIAVIGTRLKGGLCSGSFRVLGTTYIRASEPAAYWIAITLWSAFFLFLLWTIGWLSAIVFIFAVWELFRSVLMLSP